jgi:hypothetical protein
MLFNPEDIERLSPSARVEVQDYYVRKHFADRRRTVPERRASRVAVASGDDKTDTPQSDPNEGRRPWPRVWYRNDSSRSDRSEPSAPSGPEIEVSG